METAELWQVQIKRWEMKERDMSVAAQTDWKHLKRIAAFFEIQFGSHVSDESH